MIFRRAKNQSDNIQKIDHAKTRNIKIGFGLFSSLTHKGVAFAVSVISVPLTVKYLGPEHYGIWISINSVLGWLAISDLGLSSSLTIYIAKSYGGNDEEAAKKSISSAFFILSAVAIILLTSFFLVSQWIPWEYLFKLQSQESLSYIKPTFTIAFALFVIGIPFSIYTKILSGYQEFSIANIWAIISSILTLIAIYLACTFKIGLVGLVGSYSGATILGSIIASIWLFTIHKPNLLPKFKLYDKTEANALLATGFGFFITGITWMINSQTDTMVIAHYLGAKEVTPYAIATRLFSYSTMLQLILSSLLVPSYAEAYGKNDIKWIKRTLSRHLWLSGITTFLAAATFYFFGGEIIGHWAGKEAIPSQGVLLFLAIWNILIGIATPISNALCGLGFVKGMAIYGGITAAVNLLLSLILVKHFGSVGVVAASAISFGLINMPLTVFDIRKKLKYISFP